MSPECRVCIHAHFYQPPRENPWLDEVEIQDGAYPYHDWNQRIQAECYAPNTAARILDDRGRIVRILNNYSRMSFNIGPTLLSWMERYDGRTYGAVLEADQEGARRFGGHGPAMAQGYNHMILPLATPRDKKTQILWGIEDFRSRFRRDPEGLWLPECAADLETLDLMACAGLRFAVLSPFQAWKVKRPGSGSWEDASGGRVNTRRPYRIELPSGKGLALFFYDGPISSAVAFEGLLSDGRRFLERLRAAARETPESPALVHIATDGETYGHHHKFGEMALATVLEGLDSGPDPGLTVYGEYLEKHPPDWEVRILENSSWSCAHGVERWRSDCGCRDGTFQNPSLAWRAPLRRALDALRDRCAEPFEKTAKALFPDPWAVRDRYVGLILDRGEDRVRAFLEREAGRALTGEETVRALRLLELQRNLMLMYTSCGWFFDDPGRVETLQVLLYACRAIQLAGEALGMDLEPGFLQALALFRSNDPWAGTGRSIYEEEVRPSRVDLRKLAAHFAVMQLGGEERSRREQKSIFGYRIEGLQARVAESDLGGLVLGAGRFISRSTLHAEDYAFAATHKGGLQVQAWVFPGTGLVGGAERVLDLFRSGDMDEVGRHLDAVPGAAIFPFRSLFRDGRRRVLEHLLEKTFRQMEEKLSAVHEEYRPLVRGWMEAGVPPPKVFQAAGELVIHAALRRAFDEGPAGFGKAEALIQRAHEEGISLHFEELGRGYRGMLEALAERACGPGGDPAAAARLQRAASLVREARLPVDLWGVQNLLYRGLTGRGPASEEALKTLRETAEALGVFPAP